MIHAATDEVLERLWYAAEEARTPSSIADFKIDVSDADLRDALDALIAGGWIENAAGYRLSEAGATRARGIVRRHRLAEVLFVQALGTSLYDAEKLGTIDLLPELGSRSEGAVVVEHEVVSGQWSGALSDH